MTQNLSKSSITVGTVDKSSGPSLIWNSATQTWDDVVGTWDNPGQVLSNTSKSSIVISNLTKT